jgi:ribonuclease HI
MFEHDVPVVVDGRALGNGSTTPKAYGAYQLATGDGCEQTVRMELGTATNNEAEYRTLITAPGCEWNVHHRVLSA